MEGDKATCKRLMDKIRALKAETQKHQAALDALRELCPHDWKYEGHGHNDDLYICNICGVDKWV
jgi:hypothetical protein